ncbi:hypothetical protein F66182_2244 [Fusarium sp. NRRL 66182]|nr:hypothetical protein F66182_2244 [Fusarium sp. NRRL 66182]
MASEFVGKIKETLVPGSTTESQSHNTNTNESFSSNNEHQSFASNIRSGPLESTPQQKRPSEGVRTGEQIESLVSNVPGVSSQSEPSNAPFYQREMHHTSQAPIDAARAPPSALKEHLGHPSIEHDHPEQSSTKRHSSVSHQEEHYNLG